jgi:hypothetical protein
VGSPGGMGDEVVVAQFELVIVKLAGYAAVSSKIHMHRAPLESREAAIMKRSSGGIRGDMACYCMWSSQYLLNLRLGHGNGDFIPFG